MGIIIRLTFRLALLLMWACYLLLRLLITFGVQAVRAQLARGSDRVVIGRYRGVLGILWPWAVPRETRLQHFAVFGATGAGKSTLMQVLAGDDIAAPQGFGLLMVDIKDDLVLSLASHVAPERAKDVILFDPADTACPPAFNPLAGVAPERRTLAAAECVSALKRLHEDQWGPRQEHVLRATVLTLLETPHATLLDIVRLLTDDAYRAWAVSQVTNFSLRQFWEQEFPAIVGSKGSIANVEPLLNKLGVLTYPEIRNVLGQRRRGLDIRAAMDEGKIVLAHLPQGVLGEGPANFLAALLVGRAQLAAQSRVTVASARRKPFYLYLDEAQNYSTSALGKLLTEGRGMGVGVVVAAQFKEMLPRDLRLTLEKNAALQLTCRLQQGRHTLEAVRLQEPEAPEAMTMLRPFPPPGMAVPGQLKAIRERSRALLGQPRHIVEGEIERRMRRQKAAGESDGVIQFPGRASSAGQGEHKASRTRPRAVGEERNGAFEFFERDA